MTTPRSSGGACTLPGEYYTSQRIYDQETERIFMRRWLCVGLAAEIAEPGSYFLVDLDGESVIVLRDREGEVRAMHNVCRHRGTRLCTPTTGAFSKYIVCPYHSWAYDLTGALASAPNMKEVEGFEPASLPLHSVAVRVWEGLVFVNLAQQPQPFDEALAQVLARFDRWRISELVPVHRTEYDVAANWKLLLQNYSECYHCPTLHPVLNKLTPYRDTSNDLTEGAVLGGPMRLSDGNDSMTMDGRSCAPPLGDLAGDDLRLVLYYVLFPSTFMSLFPDYVLLHRVVRRGPRRSTIVCQWLFHPAAAAEPDFDPSGAIEFWDLTNRQDWHICEQSQQGIASRAYRPGPYSNLESQLAAIDREYLGALLEGVEGGSADS